MLVNGMMVGYWYDAIVGRNVLFNHPSMPQDCHSKGFQIVLLIIPILQIWYVGYRYDGCIGYQYDAIYAGTCYSTIHQCRRPVI